MSRSRSGLISVVIALALGWVASPAGAKGAGGATVPGAPTITAVTINKHVAAVAFTAPASNGGAAISHYRARCTPVTGGQTKSGFSHKSPLFVQGVRAGKPYSCTVVARNRVGYGPLSAPFASSFTGTACTSESGPATFTPALPTLSDKTLVDSVLTLAGTISGCTGGGVTSGTTAFVSSPSTGSNCTTLIKYTATPILGTLIITWNTGETSTVSIQIHQAKGKVTLTTVSGAVTAGLFAGLHETGTLSYTVPAGGCTTSALSTLTYTSITPTAFT